MNGGILLELGHPAQGRETQALELMNTFLGSIERALAEGRLSAFRWYGLEDGDLGRRAAIIVLEESPEQLDAFGESADFRELRCAAPSCLSASGCRRPGRPIPPARRGLAAHLRAPTLGPGARVR